MNAKRRRKSLSILQKREIIKLLDNGERNVDIAKKYEIHIMTVTGIKNKRQQIMSLPNSELDKKRILPRHSETLQKKLHKWITEQKHFSISDDAIQSKAINLYFEGGSEFFIPNNSWINTFKKRFNIISENDVNIIGTPKYDTKIAVNNGILSKNLKKMKPISFRVLKKALKPKQVWIEQYKKQHYTTHANKYQLSESCKFCQI
ncbi:hypothetical protein A3Q56_01058 [Intoshia linei]|uniref:HTH CENPB-type domain-containing protein n=1 Tax=Intoshia linei TaxID=1819745 RepID=A0A177BA65_9BILA|nr:hypothetical protein A3Q56_01058 [Intoshia linei]